MKTSDRQFAADVLRAEAEAVLGVVVRLDAAFERAVKMVLACKGTVITAGLGKSGIIAQKLSATFASTGTPSHFMHPTEAMHGDLGRIRRGDLAVLMSYSGESEDLLALSALLRQDKVGTIALTGRADCHLARIADVALLVGDVTEACPHNLAPTASTTAMLALSDALALAVSRKRRFSADDFRRRHPGGSLGRLMMCVVDVLRFRAGVNLPLVSDRHTIRSVLQEAGKIPRRPGAVLLTGTRGRLTGIFTDADLRRLLLQDGPRALSRPVRQVMTREPRTLTDSARLRDAVQLVREMRVDEIPVVDEAGKPIGLLDVQDLLALKVIEE